MKLEYLNGVRVTLLDHEKSPFERMLDRYNDMVEKHYSDASTQTEKEREQKLKAAKKHLEHERRHLETIASVQAQLDEYRKVGLGAVNGDQKEKLKIRNVLLAEKHHPTEVL
jgi:F0F1-type ATP synthase membrane subunit b/b'